MAVLSAVALFAACSTLGTYPDHWHAASDVIHVYVSDPTAAIEIPTTDEGITLLEAVSRARVPALDMSHVVVSRRIGDQMVKVVVDVGDMLLTGNTAKNMQLRPGDVIAVAG